MYKIFIEKWLVTNYWEDFKWQKRKKKKVFQVS